MLTLLANLLAQVGTSDKLQDAIAKTRTAVDELARVARESQVVTTAPSVVTDATGGQPIVGLSIDASTFFINLIYLAAAILFVFGLKMMSSPRTARNGNRVAGVGMLLAIIVTLLENEIVGYGTILAAMVVGTAVGWLWAVKVPMTGMPEMVAIFNGSGGAASAVVAIAEYMRFENHTLMRGDIALTIGLSVLIGMITLLGSLVAFGKLRGMTIQGVRLGNPLTFSMQHPLNFGLMALAVLLLATITLSPSAGWAVLILLLISTALGVLLVIPIGGADMPVVVSLLNSYSGLAACATGFVLENTGLIVSGSLVGASGLILTNIMCKAMDRSLVAVLAGGFGQETSGAGSTQSAEGLTVRKMDAEEAAMVLEAAQNVVIVPGYGMAVAQAQHAVAEMAAQLQTKGINVQYAIHPVAGRMPGHMNVLLAEANVPYELLHDLELNGEMAQTDVALVIGANDVVNPSARDDPGSQIYGMPIFEVDKCKTVMVCKRSLNPGFAGIENPLFYKENTVMLFGDAKAMISGILTELKAK